MKIIIKPKAGIVICQPNVNSRQITNQQARIAKAAKAKCEMDVDLSSKGKTPIGKTVRPIVLGLAKTRHDPNNGSDFNIALIMRTATRKKTPPGFFHQTCKKEKLEKATDVIAESLMLFTAEAIHGISSNDIIMGTLV